MATQTATELQPLGPSIAARGTVSRSHGPIVELDDSPAVITADEATPPNVLLPKARAVIVITQVCGVQFFSSFCSGILVIALPAIQSALKIEEALLVWPTSSYYLAAGSCLLLTGAIADVAGPKRINLVGSSLGAVFALACGLSRSGGEIIAFRAIQGICNAIQTPSSISIISSSLEDGQPRNIGLSCLGLSLPFGFGFGLVLAGVLTDTVGWRPAFYLAAAASLVLSIIGIWALPKDSRPETGQAFWKRLASEIDWVGLMLATIGLATLSYLLASLSADISSIRKVPNIVLLAVSILSIPSFVAWMHRQVKLNRTALIPNSLWRSHVFTSCCIMVLLTNALTNCMEVYSSLFFQQIQGISALGASLRVLPSLIAGAVVNLSTGIFVARVSVLWTLLISSVLSTVAPLLMALIRVDQLYWKNAFVAQVLTTISCDFLFTVGLLIISDNFPKRMQALSGAVFITCAQLGSAIGLSVTQVIASSVTSESSYAHKSSPEALMEGYRAVFWTMFGWMVFLCLVCVVGLRRVGVVGEKRD